MTDEAEEQMISFASDYMEGCLEEILDALAKTNREQAPGYGADRFTLSAGEKIRAACACPEAEVYLINGGTQTNQLAIDTLLKPYEGVLSAESGHVNVHEAGAIEFTGHKVLTLPSHEGKVSGAEVEQFVRTFWADENHEHMVFPGMVYISHPTEYGTLYTAEELKELSRICHENQMCLYLDGARLGYGLQAKGTDVTLPLIAELTDAFYFGGTKVGALCGEALVFPHQNAPSHFMTRIKQHGALSAKSRLAGIQFDTLFSPAKDSPMLLHEAAGRHAIETAEALKCVFRELGVRFYLDSPTNQQFVVLANDKIKQLQQKVAFEFWEPYDETHTIVRFATSWATMPESIEELRRILQNAAPL